MPRLDKTLRGIMLPDKRWRRENLAPNDGTATGSSYTEQSPRPGTSVPDDVRSDLLVAVSHAQDRAVEIATRDGGNPGVLPGASIMWREPGETDEEYRGWNAPNLLQSWESIDYTDAFDYRAKHAITIPKSGRVIVAYHRAGVSTTLVRTWDDASGWSSATLLGPAADAPILFLLPSGRVLLITGQMYASDDEGLTWTQLSGVPPGFPGQSILLGERYVGGFETGGVLVLVTESGTVPPQFDQYVSRDLGNTWELVANSGASFGESGSLMRFDDGSIGMAYLEDTASLLSFVRVATPFDSLFGATEIAVGGLLAATQHLATYVDFDGVAYIIAGNTNGLIGAVRSRDRGDTWSDYRWTALAFSSANANFAHTRAVPVRGGCLLVHSHEASTDTHEDSVHAAWLGGWNRMSQNESGDGASPGYDEVEIQRYGLGLDLANALQAALTWVPFEIPSNTGWASVGAGSFTLASGAGNFVSAANNRRFEDTALTGIAAMGFVLDIQPTADGSSTVTAMGLRLRVADGVNDRRLAIRIDHTIFTALVIDDNTGGTLASFVYGSTAGTRLIFMGVVTETGSARVFAWETVIGRPDGNMVRRVNLAAGGLTNAGVPLANSEFQWGNCEVGTASCSIRQAGYNSDDSDLLIEVLRERIVDDLGQGRRKFGKHLGALPYPIPLAPVPTTAPGPGTQAFVELRGGPANPLESHTIEPAHDYSIDNLFCELSPSPSTLWRSVDDSAEQIITFEIGDLTRIGSSWIACLAILQANFRTALLEVDTTGTGTWVLIGTWDATLGASLDWDRYGDRIEPRIATTPDALRFIWRNELVGGHFIQATADNPTILAAPTARLVGNSAGAWTGGDTARPILELRDTGHPAPLAGGGTTGWLVAPSGVLYVQLDGLPADFIHGFRVRIPRQPMGDPYFEAGLMKLGAVSPFGQQWSRGYSVETRPNARTVRSPFGTIRKVQEGPPATRWVLAWPDGVKLQALRQDAAPDYLGASGKPAAVASQDVWRQLVGLLQESKSGEIPVVACAEIPVTGSAMVTDPTLFLYGTLEGSARFDHVLGDEGLNEFGRMAPITVQGIK